ncbi:MAG TPA: hypothetical protein VJT32_14360 [bacterium]|nr:hypothetical protein [bacterium]
MASTTWSDDTQDATAAGFAEAVQLKGRVADIYLSNGTKLDAARIKEVSPTLIQVTHKDRIKYVNTDHIVMIELG